MFGEQGSIAVHKTVHLVKFTGKGCSIFLSNSYVTLLSTTGYKVLKYLSRIRIVYNFRFVLMLGCFSPEVFCHGLARSTSKPDFLLSNFGFGVLHIR